MTTAATLALEAITVTLTNPGAAPITINTTDAGPAAFGDALSAVESLQTVWRRPSPRDHEQEGRLTLVLRFAAPAAVDVDALVSVTVDAAGAPPIILPGYWVESVTWSPVWRPEGAGRRLVWIHTISATNGPGRAAGVRLAADPWPELQTLEERLEAINAAAPVALVDLAGTAANLGGPSEIFPPLVGRDVDNADAWEVIQTTANTWAYLAAASPAGVALYSMPAAQLFGPTFYGAGLIRWAITYGPAPALLPASAVEQGARTLSRRGLVTEATIRFYAKESDTGKVRDVSRTWSAAAGRPSAQVTYATDYRVTETSGAPINPQTATPGDLARVAAALVGETRPRPILAAGRVVLPAVPALLPALVEPVTAHRAILQITGGPADLDPYVAVTSATLTIAAGRVGVSVELQPVALSGTKPMRWSDWPGPGDVPAVPAFGDPVPARFSHLTDAGSQDPPNTEPLSARDTALLFRPDYWR